MSIKLNHVSKNNLLSKGKTMSFKLDDFEDDIKTAEAKIYGLHNDRLRIQGNKPSDGDTRLRAENKPETQGIGTKSSPHELGLFAGISNSDYHRGDGTSSSDVKLAAKAAALYLHKVPMKETPGMALGTAFHALVLEPEMFSDCIIVVKPADKKDAVDSCVNKTIITPDQFDSVRWMRDSVESIKKSDEMIKAIFDEGVAEHSGYYIDEKTGLLCKYRPDMRSDFAILDLKSSRDISRNGFKRTIYQFGYHTSASHYLEGDEAIFGTDHRQFVFLCTQSEPPYLSTSYLLGEKLLTKGDDIRRVGLDRIKHGIDTGEWPTYNDGITTIIDD